MSLRHRSSTATTTHIGEQQRRARRIALLDDDFVARQPQRIARHLQRDVIVAAEIQFRRGVELALGNVGREFDIARRQHVARHRDDSGARVDLAGRRLHRDVAAAPADLIGRRRQRQRQLLAEFGDQRAQALAAGDRGVAILRADLVDHGNILQILARGIGAEHEFRRPRPVAEILGQHGRAGHIGLAAGGFIDGAIGAHQRGKKLLGFPGPGVTAADADFLTQRRRRDVEPGAARELDHRIGFGIVQPSRATIERHPERRGIGEATPADLGRGLHHDHLAVRRLDAPRRRDAGRTGADHDNIGLARQWRGPCAGAKRPASAQMPPMPTGNRAASLSCQGFRNF